MTEYTDLNQPETIGKPPEQQGKSDTLGHDPLTGSGHGSEHHDDGAHHVHVTPFWPMFGTLIALLILTAITVWTAKDPMFYVSNGVNLTIALIIASIKGTLVAAFFMHLIWDTKMNTIVVVSTFFAIILFFTLTIVDFAARPIHEPLEVGEIVPGGGAPDEIWTTEDILDDEGNVVDTRLVRNKKGTYNPWHSASPSTSVLDKARAAAAQNKKPGKGDGEHAGDVGEDTAADLEADAIRGKDAGTTLQDAAEEKLAEPLDDPHSKGGVDGDS